MALNGGRPAPTHVIAHLSDPHLLGAPDGLAGRIDTASPAATGPFAGGGVR